MTSDLFDALLVTADNGLGRSHCFEVDAAHRFITAWQGKDGATLHRIGDELAILTTEKFDSLRNLQLVGERHEVRAFRPVINNLVEEVRILPGQLGDSAKD